MVKSYGYDEFGNATEGGDSSFLNEVTFTGAVTDSSSGFNYMNARFYDPESGRFLSKDTYAGSASSPVTQNLYTYGNNNPTNMVDPTGHFALPLIAASAIIGAAISVGITFIADISDGKFDTPASTYAAAGVAGLVSGATLGLGAGAVGLGSAIVTGFTAGYLGDCAFQAVSKGSIDQKQAATSGVLGAGTAGLLYGLSNMSSNVNSSSSSSGAVSVEEGGNTAYRYVSEGELNTIKKTGTIPNTDRSGNLKDIFVSPGKYDLVADAENALQIGTQNPFGATQSPTYRVEFNTNGIRFRYAGNVEGGTGIEMITEQSISIDLSKIFMLK